MPGAVRFARVTGRHGPCHADGREPVIAVPLGEGLDGPGDAVGDGCSRTDCRTDEGAVRDAYAAEIDGNVHECRPDVSHHPTAHPAADGTAHPTTNPAPNPETDRSPDADAVTPEPAHHP